MLLLTKGYLSGAHHAPGIKFPGSAVFWLQADLASFFEHCQQLVLCRSDIQCCFAWRCFLPFEVVLGRQCAPEMKGTVGTPIHFACLNSSDLLIAHYPVGSNFKVPFLSKTRSPLSLEYAQSQFPAGLNFSFKMYNISKLLYD